MKRYICIILSAFLILLSLPVTVFAADEDIVILYENDVHCAVEGYSKIAAMKAQLSESTPYVGVVSVGDYIQGSSLGAISQGEYIVNIMNLVGYDAVILGNHEFDYKLPQLMELSGMMDTKPVCCNFRQTASDTTVFEPYSVISYGDVDIAYIGVTTPDTLTSSSPSQFLDENGDYAYTFSGTRLYDTVQHSIDAAKAQGADYVVALTHLGTEDVNEQWSAQAVVRNTSGLDVVLDGHSHSVVESMVVSDEEGNDVILSSTGTKFANIGKLTISDTGITTELIPTESYDKTDAAVSAYIAQINEEYNKLGERMIGISEVTLTTLDENGNRIIRNSEANIGDFCADAFRLVTGADIGFINGGGIRDDIPAGDVTFNDILSVFPFNNRVCVIKATGQQIVDMLELGVLNYPNEDGTFQHVSGITFDLDATIPSSVKLDENMVFVGVEGERRVKNAKVLNTDTGEYENIDPYKVYTLASHNYLLLDQGGGASMFKGAEVVSDSGMLDVELLEVYITENLDGVVGKEYAKSQGRINILSTKVDGDDTQNSTETSETTTAPAKPDVSGATDITAATGTAGADTGFIKTGDSLNSLVWCVAVCMVIVSAVIISTRTKRKKSR